MARHVRGLTGALQHGLPARGAGGLALMTVWGRGARADTPAGRRGARPFAAIRHEQYRRHTMAAGCQRQAAAGREIEIGKLGDNEAGCRRTDRLFRCPECVCQLAG